MLANLPAGETAVAKIHRNTSMETVISAPVGVADGIVAGQAGVGSGGVAGLDDAVPSGAVALSTAHCVGIYTRGQQLVLCSSVETHEYVQLVDVGRLPAYEGSIEVRGLLALIRRAHKGIGYMDVYGIAAGLEHGVRGQWHFHEGFNCDGGMQRIEDTNTLFPLLYQGFGWGYYTHRSRIRAVDPWTTTMYQSNRQGVALIHEVFSLDSGEYWSQIAQSVASHRDKCGGWLPPTFRGRAAIFHHSRIMYPQPTGYYSRSFQFMACGIVGKYIPTVVRHRLNLPPLSMGGACMLGWATFPSIHPPCTALSHCAFHALEPRLNLTSPVAIHCAYSTPQTSALVLTERYPLETFAAYNGSREVQMMAYLSQAGSSLQLLAVLTGLPPLTNGSWTIYTGFRCSTNIRPDKRGRPYPFDVGLPYAGSRAGLWQDTTRWSADAQGNAIVKWSTGLISLDEVAGRQLIVSLADGSRAACGPIQITTSPVAWLAGGEGQVRGLVVAVQAFAGVIVRGTLFGLDPSAVPPSWHIGDVGSLTGADVCKLEGSPLVVQLKPLAVSADVERSNSMIIFCTSTLKPLLRAARPGCGAAHSASDRTAALVEVCFVSAAAS